MKRPSLSLAERFSSTTARRAMLLSRMAHSLLLTTPAVRMAERGVEDRDLGSHLTVQLWKTLREAGSEIGFDRSTREPPIVIRVRRRGEMTDLDVSGPLAQEFIPYLLSVQRSAQRLPTFHFEYEEDEDRGTSQAGKWSYRL